MIMIRILIWVVRIMVLGISQLGVGDKAVVRGISSVSAALKQRLLAFGILPNSLIEIVRLAPLGGPVQLRLQGDFMISMRKEEAQAVKVEKITA